MSKRTTIRWRDDKTHFRLESLSKKLDGMAMGSIVEAVLARMSDDQIATHARLWKATRLRLGD